MRHFWASDSLIALKYFSQKPLIIFVYFLGPFTVQKLQNIVTMNWKLWRHIIFEPKMTHLLQREIYSQKPLIYFSCNFHGPFHCGKFLKIHLSRSRFLRTYYLWDLNYPMVSKRIFYYKGKDILDIAIVLLLCVKYEEYPSSSYQEN